jgi:hypothetical protein
MKRRRQKQYQSRAARSEGSEESEEGKGELLALIDKTNCVVSSRMAPEEMMWSEGSDDGVEQQQVTGL